jgi:hypothetical protein
MVGILSPKQVVKVMAEIEGKVGKADSMHARLDRLALEKMKGFLGTTTPEEAGANSVGEVIRRLQVSKIHATKDAERFVNDISLITHAIYDAARAEEKNVTNEYGIWLKKITGATVMGPIHFRRIEGTLKLNPLTANALNPLLDKWTTTNCNISAWENAQFSTLAPKIQELERATNVFNANLIKKLKEEFILMERERDHWKNEDSKSL